MGAFIDVSPYCGKNALVTRKIVTWYAPSDKKKGSKATTQNALEPQDEQCRETDFNSQTYPTNKNPTQEFTIHIMKQIELSDIYAIFPRNPVLLPLEPGTKIIKITGWPDFTFEKTQEPGYQTRLKNSPSIGILLGKNSGNLIFFDWDTQAAMDWFLENNPEFRKSFRVTGRGVGGQVGGYCKGEYPGNANLFVPKDSPLAVGCRKIPDPDNGMRQIGEIRGDRLQSVLVGIHPDTRKPYRWVNPSSPIDFEFAQIKWHPDINRHQTHEQSLNGSGEHREPTPIGIAARFVTIDFLWKHFNLPDRPLRTNGKFLYPCASPFRDDNNIEHYSFSVHFDQDTGKQVFKDFHGAYQNEYKGDSFEFFKRVSKLEGLEAIQTFLGLAETLQSGGTPAGPVIQPEIHIPPIARVAAVAPIGPAAYQGFIGEWVKYVAPLTECNDDNILLQFVVTLGIVFGRRFYTFAGQDLFTNLFLVMLGPTGSRKGTALVPVKKFFEAASPDWLGARGGWKSGEALIHFTRDPVYGLDRKGNSVLRDGGVTDKRILVEETELVHLFKAAERAGNTVIGVLRQAWESPERLFNTSKGSSAVSTAAHIGAIGHMTAEEFLMTDPRLITGGLINRVTWGNAYRTRKLPNVQPIEWPAKLLEWFRDIYAYAHGPTDVTVAEGFTPPACQHLPLDPGAQLLWEKIYDRPEETGWLTEVLIRYFQQARKFANIYAVCEKSDKIRYNHLEAGIAIADHSEANARVIFADFGPNKTANRILSALRRNPEGMNVSTIRDHVFAHKASGDEIHEAIIMLAQNKLVTTEGRIGKAFPIWRAM